MKKYIHREYNNYEEPEKENDIFCMSNLCGKDIRVPHKMPFSFYFSARNSNHAIRVKPVYNPDHIDTSSCGTLELHGAMKYIPNRYGKHISNEKLKEMREFFTKYKVIFAAVWESELSENSAIKYFTGSIPFYKFLKEFYFYEDYAEEMNQIETIEELKDFVEDNHIFNMWN